MINIKNDSSKLYINSTNTICWETGSATSLENGTTYSPYLIDDFNTEISTTASTYFNNYVKSDNYSFNHKYKIDYGTATHTLAYKEYNAFATGGQYYYENTGTYVNNSDGWVSFNTPVLAPADRLRQMIRDRMGPSIHRGRKRTSLSIAMDVREERARQTLRRIIGEQAYRKFFRDGFITVVPKSGLTYRIFPGHGITEVYDRGIMVDRLCVVLQGNFPPTDSLLMRYLLILNDEGEFSKYAVKHSVRQGSGIIIAPDWEVKPLTETWTKLKVA